MRSGISGGYSSGQTVQREVFPVRSVFCLGTDRKFNSNIDGVPFFDQNISDDTLKGLMAMGTAIYKANRKVEFLANDKGVFWIFFIYVR